MSIDVNSHGQGLSKRETAQLARPAAEMEIIKDGKGHNRS
jgi:hypothetical protein